MHFSTLIAALAAPLMVAAAPNPGAAKARQAPTFCTRMDPPPTAEETEERFNLFVEAFINQKDIPEAFTYIVPDYINHNPMASNGAQNAYDILNPIWGGLQMELLRTKFEGDMSWVNYRSSMVGEVVDRFRWEAGCIAEHWDAGEVFPAE